jgi:hypothetical protein
MRINKFSFITGQIAQKNVLTFPHKGKNVMSVTQTAVWMKRTWLIKEAVLITTRLSDT